MTIRIPGLYLKPHTANSMAFQESKYQASKAQQPKPLQWSYPDSKKQRSSLLGKGSERDRGR